MRKCNFANNKCIMCPIGAYAMKQYRKTSNKHPGVYLNIWQIPHGIK